MMKHLILAVLVLGVFALWAQGLQAALGLGGSVNDLDLKNGPVVVELFTSQSCSSCPSADKVLSELAKNNDVIALGCHVTYWNHLHWEDTLSMQNCTQRQRSYATYRKSRRVYTPQMVVNGQAEFTGSHRVRAREEVSTAPSIARIDLAFDGQSLGVNLPAIEEGSYHLTVFGTKDSHTQHVPRGENRGRTLTYSNSVLLLESAGLWKGGLENRSFDLGKLKDLDHLVIIAQIDGYGPIVAAGRLDL